MSIGRLVLVQMKVRLARIVRALRHPSETFQGIAEEPSYLDILIISLIVIASGLIVSYSYWVKLIFYDVDLRRVVDVGFLYQGYLIEDALYVGVYLLILHFAIYYIGTWALRGRGRAKAILVCTGYTMAPQVPIRVLEAFLSYLFYPTFRYDVSSAVYANLPYDATSLVLMTTSLQLLLLHQRRGEEALKASEESFRALAASPLGVGISLLTLISYLWAALLAAKALSKATKCSLKRSAAIAGVGLALDTILYSLTPG